VMFNLARRELAGELPWCCNQHRDPPPGESYSKTVTWDGIPPTPPRRRSARAFHIGRGDLPAATFQIAAHLVYTLTTEKSVYYSGGRCRSPSPRPTPATNR
jgi:hypothetical protein